jgi:hypothetical protein
MTDNVLHLVERMQSDDGVIGRIALVVLILAIIVVAALVALIIPN